MGISEIHGNIFTTKAQTIVNTINCVGVMGAGIALEFRLREPEMFRRYTLLCDQGRLAPGILWLYRSTYPQVLNFPTKTDWKQPSRVEYLEQGLQKFCDTYKDKEISSIAFPLIGADKGGLSEELSRSVMRRYLEPLKDLHVEIYSYDPYASDDVFNDLKQLILSRDIASLMEATGITKERLAIITSEVNSGRICQIGQLGAVKGIGVGTLEKLFALKGNQLPLSQKSLF